MGGYDQAFMDVMHSKLAQDIMNAYDQGAKDKEAEIMKTLDGLMRFKTDTQARIDHKLALQVLKDALIKGENK